MDTLKNVPAQVPPQRNAVIAQPPQAPALRAFFKSTATRRKLPADERITHVSYNWNFNAFCHNTDVAADSNAPEARRGVPYDTVCNRPIA